MNSLLKDGLALARNLEELGQVKDYPCVAGLRSLQTGNYSFGVYGPLGKGENSEFLARDLKKFVEDQARTGSVYQTFIAGFQKEDLNEEEFEIKLWKELSILSEQDPSEDWDSNFSSHPDDDDFCFSFCGKALFVVGMHPNASRRARQFPSPILIFNIYDQFVQLMKEGKFEPLVETIREREIAYAGSVNPMVEKYSEKREAIQFSGKENPPEWKCPFHRFFKNVLYGLNWGHLAVTIMSILSLYSR